MKTARIRYEGNLRTTAEHIRSGRSFITDAPIDNNGKGEAFSPTDLIATATLTCMITVMGIHANRNDLMMGDVDGEVLKVMASAPRRVAELHIEINFSNHNLSDSDKSILEKIALSCPVVNSIHPDIMVNVKFSYN